MGDLERNWLIVGEQPCAQASDRSSAPSSIPPPNTGSSITNPGYMLCFLHFLFCPSLETTWCILVHPEEWKKQQWGRQPTWAAQEAPCLLPCGYPGSLWWNKSRLNSLLNLSLVFSRLRRLKMITSVPGKRNSSSLPANPGSPSTLPEALELPDPLTTVPRNHHLISQQEQVSFPFL